MKTIKRSLMILAAVVLVGACAKPESNNNQNNTGGGQTAVPVTCLPDNLGNVPVGCPVPSTATVRLEGDVVQTSETSALPVIKDNPGRIEQAWYNPFSFSWPVRRCGTGFAYTCENECNNFRYGSQVRIQISNGNGTLSFRAGPYHAPGICDRQFNDSYYVVDVPVWIYNTNGNQGFTVQSAAMPSNKVFSIEVDAGILKDASATQFSGRVFYNGSHIGDVLLYRKTN